MKLIVGLTGDEQTKSYIRKALTVIFGRRKREDYHLEAGESKKKLKQLLDFVKAT